MKKYLISASIFLLLAACQMQEEYVPVEPESGFTGETEEFAGETRTSLNESNSVVWSVNDLIAVFQGSSIADKFEVTDASAGKTTGSFKEVTSEGDGGFVSGNEIPDNVAVYPYMEDLECANGMFSDEDAYVYKIENVHYPSTQKYQESSFPDDAFVMVAVTSGVKDNKLRFRNVSGALRLRISGDVTIKSIEVKGNSDELISGLAEIYAPADAADAPSVVMQSNASRKVTLDCGDGVKLSSTSAKDFIIALPLTTFSEGFTVTITDKSGKKDVRTSQHKNVINRSTILGMPEIVFGEGDLSFDKCTVLGVDETANSYIVSESGSYRFPAVKGNGTKSVGAVASVEVLWETFGTDEAIHKGDLISSVAYEGGNILFRTASRFREGNAVIAARNSSGTILWSWHIWLTDQPKEHVYKNGAGTMMDRNLGATSATPGDVGALGLKYQWGRKDPFLTSADIHSNVAVASTLEWPSSVSISSTTGTVDYSVANPTVRLYGSDYDDWLYNHDSSLWDAEKTIYDPCPAGWRVPAGGSKGVWATAKLAANGGFDKTNEGVKFSIEQPSYTWYPVALTGNTDYRSASYWSVDVFETESYQFTIIYDDKSLLRTYNWEMPRYQSQYVRCYKEDSANPRIDYVDEYGVNHGKGTEIDGVVWAPVNCGYHATNFKYGKLYQWGRKYGQGYNGKLYDVNNYEVGTYRDYSIPTIRTGPESLSTGQSKSNEKYFYKATSSPYDWLSPQNDELWNSGDEADPVKTQYDPCPDGWRVPTYAELDNLISHKSSWTTRNNQPGYWFSGSHSHSSSVPRVFFPAVGLLNLDGKFFSRGLYGYYWSSRPEMDLDIGFAYQLDMFGDNSLLSGNAYLTTYGSYRAYGCAVRCVQE